ncbi:peptidoglycan-binding protein [Rhodobacter sp. SGA-6-6]|uniref:peptidoglycan-binding domain-containing protein n=1 Tax=Rhodobacter sp. SGA-6-6 TaxID=2710882 RepID=UPI0013EA5D7B|nr:peptidoglycan-binding protein [Rhodobacter sp. SGA-6-6]NGM46161.1 peptidoglycan-binding protein [Rhodobacter sp. SGA-6-6]
MRKTSLALMIGSGLALGAPVPAQDLGDIISGVAQGLFTQELDRAAYEEARRANTLRSWRAYLQKFPDGAYRVQAERAIARLGGTVTVPDDPEPGTSSAAAVEARLGLSRDQRRLIQRQLTALGYNTGGADGLWGRNTRDAIRRWQAANRAEATGYVTARQVRLIGEQAGTRPDIGDDAGADDRLEERLLGLTSAERREIQRRLTLLGYNTRGADGVFGSNTRRAIAAWQRDEGLRASGYITADQLRELRRQTGAS